MKFRKKPVVIDAVRWVGTNLDEVLAFCHTQASVRDIGPPDTTKRRLVIETLEADMRAESGDWIIRGVKGEFYHCKPDIFAATYELAECSAPSEPQTPEPENGNGGIPSELKDV